MATIMTEIDLEILHDIRVDTRSLLALFSPGYGDTRALRAMLLETHDRITDRLKIHRPNVDYVTHNGKSQWR